MVLNFVPTFPINEVVPLTSYCTREHGGHDATCMSWGDVTWLPLIRLKKKKKKKKLKGCCDKEGEEKVGRGRFEGRIEVGFSFLMDWGDMKIPSWDLSELEHDTEPNIGTDRTVVSASSSGGGGGLGERKNEMDCSVDLKLGGLGDFGCSSSRWKDHSKVPTLAVSTHPGPSKRPRAPNNGTQKVSCLVDGCKSDLSNSREYHRRHKVCEAHSKTPIVLVGGQEQRFCQQCSRFHQLVEFDEVKRSCRKRLDGHNRRRRKPQPEPLRTGSLLPNLQVPRFSSYSHMFPTTAPDPTWGGLVVKDEENMVHRFHQPPLHFNLDRQHSFPPESSYARSYPEGKRFPFLQDNEAAGGGGGERSLGFQTSCCQPLINTISFSGSSSSSNGVKFFSSDRGLTQVLDSDCALSLLSSPTQTPSVVNITHHRIPVGQPLAQSLQQQFRGLGSYNSPRSQSSNNVSTTGFSCSGMENEHVGSSSVLVSGATTTDATDLHCSGTFHVGAPSSSALPFSWPQQ